MHFTTRKLLFRAANTLRINRYFHRLTPLKITAKETDLISPVEAKLQAVVPYSHDHICIIKNKQINLTQQLGDDAHKFDNGTVCSFYLAPANKHFRLMPASGTVVHLHAQSGTAKYFQTLLGAEKIIRHLPYLRHHNLLQKALTRNATHTTILKTPHGHLALIAIGSLGVNHIHCTLER